jgi:hypothetical protein
MAPTISGGQGQFSTPRLADPLQHPQRINSGRSTAAPAVTGATAASDAPDHAPAPRSAHERAALAELALLLAAQQVAISRGNTLAQQIAVWRPFR